MNEEPKHSLQIQHITSWLMRWRWVLLALGIVWLIPAMFIARRIKLEKTIESLYAINNPHLVNFQKSKQIFGGDEFVIIAFEDPELIVREVVEDDEETEVYEELSRVSYERIKQFSLQLQQIPGVRFGSVQDLANATTPKNVIFQFLGKERTVTGSISDEKLFKLVEGMLIGEDHITTAIAMRLEPQVDFSRAESIQRIRQKAKEFENDHHLKTYIVGEPVQVHDMFLYVDQDGQTLFFISLGLLAAVIFVYFRNIRWMLLPLFVVLLAVFTTEAMLVLSNIRLSMVSSLLNSLVTIISIATVTHITIRFREHLHTKDRKTAFTRTLTELFPPIFWTILTTAVGFFVLISSDITPVQIFGLMMGMATLFVLCATVISLPGGAMLGRRQYSLGVAPAENRLSSFLVFLNQITVQKPKQIGLIFLILILFAGGGLFRLQVETDFSKNFRDSSPIVQSLNFVESRLGGAGTWEVNFPAPHKMTRSYLGKVRQLSDQLHEETNKPDDIRLTKILCITDGLDAIPRLPIVSNNLTKKIRLLNTVQPEFGSTLYNAQAGRMRIMLRSKERQPADEKIKLIKQVHTIAQQWATTELADEYPDAKVQTTGLFVLLAYLIDNLLRDQMLSFILAACGITLMMMIAFRHMKIGIISLIPNLFPIILVVGGMGWFGLPINIATAMIASVSLGLTIDSSIHYLFEFQQSRQTLSFNDALLQTHQRVGRAMVFSNIALIVGFSVLMFSHFIPLVYFGILVSLAMLGGLVGNLILLPLLLRWAIGSIEIEPLPKTKTPLP